MNHKPRAIILIISVMMVALSLGTSTPAKAATLVPFGPSHSLGNLALNWAETQTGKPYTWGGTGPYGYDCSGLVWAAFQHEGITLPRTTYAMLNSSHLVRVYTPERGDLAFYGTGHVEFVTIWPDTTFGAHDYGSPVSWITYGGGWYPTMFFRVV